MEFSIDHDLHIHSLLSLCSGDSEQSTDAILAYGVKNGFKQLCITDHFWDENIDNAPEWYKKQNYEHIRCSLPLPQDKNTRFYFGCETEMDKHFNIAVTDERISMLDFVIIPTTHLHMMGLTLDEKDDSISARRVLFLKRFERLLEKDLPFNKIGLAHITCSLMAPKNFNDHLELLSGISDREFEILFNEAAKKGLGIELNFPFNRYDSESIETILRPYLIAKEAGCKFYLGSDAHHPGELIEAYDNFKSIVSALQLSENDKFNPFT